MAKKKKSFKTTVLDVAFFVGGLVFGELIAYLVRNIGFLKWLSFEVSGTLDLVLISISIHLNPAVILFPLLAVIGGRILKQAMSEPKRPRKSTYHNDQDEYSDDDQYYDA